MFIKKDLRKIDEILTDEKDSREVLKLAKRGSEFNGSLRIICRENRLNSLGNLKILNLYDNSLTNVQGIGLLSRTPVEEINLGSNKLSSLPVEFSRIDTLKILWLEDNEFDQFPTCVCQLKELKELRMSGNCIKFVPSLISAVQNLETLSLDRNELTEFPEGILKLPELQHLWLRQNQIKELPSDLDSMDALITLSVSSNLLTKLPDSLAGMTRLEFLYANGNSITMVPDSLCLLGSIKEVNLSNNKLTALPPLWDELWGPFDASFASANKEIRINLVGNLLGTAPSKSPSKSITDENSQLL